MRQNILLPALADLSASADTVYTMKMPFAGVLYVKQCYAVYEEAVAAGGFSSTTPVTDIAAGVGPAAVSLGTMSPDLTNGQAVGDCQKFTKDATNVPSSDGIYKFAAGDTISVRVTTQGAGGTTTGTQRVMLIVDTDSELTNT